MDVFNFRNTAVRNRMGVVGSPPTLPKRSSIGGTMRSGRHLEQTRILDRHRNMVCWFHCSLSVAADT